MTVLEYLLLAGLVITAVAAPLCRRMLATGMRFLSVSSKATVERSMTSVPWLPAIRERRSSSESTSSARMSSL